MFGNNDRMDRIEERLARLEKTMLQLLEALGPDLELDGSVGEPGGATDEVMDLIARNRTIEAIKLYREQTGMGLKEAKEAVDRLAKEARGR